MSGSFDAGGEFVGEARAAAELRLAVLRELRAKWVRECLRRWVLIEKADREIAFFEGRLVVPGSEELVSGAVGRPRSALSRSEAGRVREWMAQERPPSFRGMKLALTEDRRRVDPGAAEVSLSAVWREVVLARGEAVSKSGAAGSLNGDDFEGED